MRFSFTVFGHPQPQGSSRAFFVKSLGRSVITTTNTKLKPWRQQVSETAMTLPDVKPFGNDSPVKMTLDFYFARPKSAKKRPGMTVKPDVDKLTRAIFDALKGIVLHDDSQVVSVTANKHYGDPERVDILVEG